MTSRKKLDVPRSKQNILQTVPRACRELLLGGWSPRSKPPIRHVCRADERC